MRKEGKMGRFDEVILATGNAGKVAELKPMLAGWNVLGMAKFGAKSPIEDGGSLVANARIKARALLGKVGKREKCLILADDTGLEVDALDGAPGVETAHFGGWRVLLERLVSVQKPLRTARFRCVVMVVDAASGEERIFEGVCEGRIAEQARGEQGFGYDPVFIPEGYDTTFAEMGVEKKETLSHRGKAMGQFLAWAKAL
jgi:XTP/dITP diphosphohydrolase